MNKFSVILAVVMLMQHTVFAYTVTNGRTCASSCWDNCETCSSSEPNCCSYSSSTNNICLTDAEKGTGNGTITVSGTSYSFTCGASNGFAAVGSLAIAASILMLGN